MTQLSRYKIYQEIQGLKRNNPNFMYLLQMHINYECNIIHQAKCREYCYQAKNQLQRMTFPTFKKIIDKYTPRQIALGGGEPTIHHEFLTLIRYAKEEAKVPVKHVNYTTNGVMLPKNFEEVQKLVSGISISLDSLRYPDLFTNGIPPVIKKNLEIYQKSPIQVIVNFVINEKNLHELDKLIPFLKENGLQRVYILSYKEVDYFFPFSRHEFKQVFSNLLINAIDNNILIALDCCLATFESRKNHCGAGKRFLAINSDGTSDPCSFASLIGNTCPFLENLEKEKTW